MTKIKIRSNPYNREISYLTMDEATGQWVDVRKTDERSRLRETDSERSFLPFKIKEIITIIIKEYYVGREKVQLYFEGTQDEYSEVEAVCESDDVKDKIELIRTNTILENARFIKGDIKEVLEGDNCPCCDGKLYFKKGIEVGNTFKLGTKYSEKLGLTYLDENNNSNPVVMGCYGIGAGRILAAVVEQNNDEKGIIFPIAVAPFKVAIALMNPKDEVASLTANKLYDELNNLGIDTLLDDRDERAGVKFNDLDLIGIPIRITVGKKINEGLVEFKLRCESESLDIKLDEIANYVKEYIDANKW